MDSAFKQTLKNDVRDIYPRMDFYKTEEKRPDVKRFKSYENLSKEDSYEVFKEVLRDQGVSTSWKWEDANRVIMSDPRIKAIKTIGERKVAFNEYISEMKLRERNDVRTRR